MEFFFTQLGITDVWLNILISFDKCIEGEFGTVEDMTLTYVVLKTWDWRRLVLPLNYFDDHSFVNWSFNSTQLIVSVLLYVDYSFPLASCVQSF